MGRSRRREGSGEFRLGWFREETRDRLGSAWSERFWKRNRHWKGWTPRRFWRGLAWIR
jgi:hypothetical protein